MLIKTAFFEHLKTLEKITDSIYLYENPELEYENFVHMKNITKTVFGDVVPNISVIEKIHTNSNGNIESFNTHFIKLSEKIRNYFFDYLILATKIYGAITNFVFLYKTKLKN